MNYSFQISAYVSRDTVLQNLELTVLEYLLHFCQHLFCFMELWRIWMSSHSLLKSVGKERNTNLDLLVQCAVWAKHAFFSFSYEDLYVSFAYYSFVICAYCLLTIQSFLSE
jgi:hypothetical protein